MKVSTARARAFMASVLAISSPGWIWGCSARATAPPVAAIVSGETSQWSVAESVADRGAIDASGVPVVVLEDGQVPEGGGGAPIDRLNSPFTNGLGQMAVTGALDRDGVLDYFLWFNGSILWLDSDHPEDGLDGAESTVGVSDTAEFVYGTLVNGVDSVWSDQGLVLSAGMPAPGFPAGSVVEGLARATMTPSGRFYTFAEVRLPLLEGMTRRETVSRVLYGSPGDGEQFAPILKSGDRVDGATIAFVIGLGLDYQVSDNGEHVIQVANVVDSESGMRALPAVYVDGHLPMRSGDSTENGLMTAFDLVAINDGGHYLVAGETDADSHGDVFVAYDGVPVVWEGSPVLASSSASLTPPASVRGLSIDNRGRAVHAWSTAGFGTEYLFFACDAADLAHSILLLDSQTKIDFDGDGASDAGVVKFNGGNGPILSLSEQETVYIEVEMVYNGGEQRESVIELALPECPSP